MEKVSLSMDELYAYVFRQLSKKEEIRVEQLIESDEEYATIVDGILLYCEEKNITNINTFKSAINAEKPFVTYEEKNEPGKKAFNRILLILIGAVLIISIIFISNYLINSEANNKVEEESTNQQDMPSIIVDTPLEKVPVVDNDDPISSIPEAPEKNNLSETSPTDQLNRAKTVFEQENPIRELAMVELKNELTTRSSSSQNTLIGNAKESLERGDSTDAALYIVGLSKLTTPSPDYLEAKQLLSMVNSYDKPEVEWFLFRIYVALGDVRNLRVHYNNMIDSERRTFYKENYLQDVPTELIKIAQSERK